MRIQWAVVARGDGGRRELSLRLPGRPAENVLTTADACRRLRRSRRHVYRYIRDGALSARGKYLGEWLLDAASVERLAQSPPRPGSVPKTFKPLFPEYDLKQLNPGRDRSLIMSRLLNRGGVAGVRWALRRYKPREIVAFLKEDGARLLSPEAANFWAIYFGVERPELPPWRRTGWRLGGDL